jgi:protease I
MENMSHFRVAVIAVDGVEESELTEPVKALKNAGFAVDILSKKGGLIQAFRHHDKAGKIPVDRSLDEAAPNDYSAVMLPGGALNADSGRMETQIQHFVRAINRSAKPMAFICHAPCLLISAGLVNGRLLTSYHTIQDDVKNAGGNWVDKDVVVDKNWVSSRQPSDIPAFNREMLRLFMSVAEKQAKAA